METNEQKNFSQYTLLNNKYYTYSIPITTFIALVLMLVTEFFLGNRLSFRYMEFKIYAEILPVILLTFLSGYSVGSIVVLFFFGIVTIYTQRLMYHSFVLLAASLFINLPIYRRWFLSIKKTILTFFLFNIIFGPGWNIFVRVLEGKIIEPHVEVSHLISVLPLSTFVCVFCYCYYRFFPQKIKNLFFATAAAYDVLVKFRAMLKKQKRPKISTKITWLIIIEALALLISCFGISIALFSQQFGEAYEEWEVIVFATRLVVLMQIVAVPVMLFEIGSTKASISNPLILMTMALEDTADNEIEKRSIDIRHLGISNKDEIGILYGALVHSTDVVDAYIKKVEDEKKLVNDLAVAKEANKAKDVFLSNMSHEIRTPINAVLGLDEMIIRETKEDEIRNYALDLQMAGKNLLSLVNEILDFSKIEAGRMEIIPVEYDISSTINDLMNMISKRAEDKGLELKLDVDGTLPHLLEGDEIRIKQCVINILTNAVKYTEKGSVTMILSWKKLSEERISLTFHVIDTGIGIKEEDIPKLFTAFKRIEEKRNRTIEGTGLGMNIVQNLLSLMGSELEVKSVYGQGSDFSFTVEQKVVDWTAVGERHITRVVKEHVRESFHAPDAQILVVDDTRLNLTVARGLLKQTQVKIDTAESGAETLELVKAKKYDVIFLDHRMPIMDGIETLAAMKNLDGNLNQETPCIALTANAIAGAREMYLKAGFTDYLTKPIDSEKLEKLLIKYLDKSKVTIVTDSSEAVVHMEEKSGASEIAPLDGIDISTAIVNCGSQEIFLDAVKEFYNTIGNKSESIEKFATEEDWKNYTVLVHALKSSARLIGAMELSAQAARLEQCGDTAGGKLQEEVEKAAAEIKEKTPELLELYRSYKEKLKPVAGVEMTEQGNVDLEKQPIGSEEYKSALENLKECIQSFDFDTADQIIKMLDEYQIPENETENFARIKQKISEVDQAEALKLLSNI